MSEAVAAAATNHQTVPQLPPSPVVQESLCSYLPFLHSSAPSLSVCSSVRRSAADAAAAAAHADVDVGMPIISRWWSASVRQKCGTNKLSE